MTVYTTRQIMCDAPNCTEKGVVMDDVVEVPLGRVRAEAAKRGWTVRDDRDYCRAHSGRG